MKLLALDMDGTVIRSFLREGGVRADYDLVELLPWCGVGTPLPVPPGWESGERMEIVFVTNQGGIAHGYQSVGQACRKIRRTSIAFGLPWEDGRDCIRRSPLATDLLDWRGLPFGGSRRPRAYVSFGLPDARIARYEVAEDDPWRKPGPGMLLAAMADYRVSASDAFYVGDMESDRLAAEAAGVGYADASDFFG